MEEERPFFFYWRNDTPTHEQSSDIIVAKSKGFFHHSTTFHSTFHLFRLITRIYEFLSQENDLAKRIPRLYTAWIPGRRIRLCLFTDTDEGRRMKKKWRGRLKIRVQEEIAWKLSSWEARSKDTPASQGLASTFRRLSVRFSDYSPSSSHPCRLFTPWLLSFFQSRRCNDSNLEVRTRHTRRQPTPISPLHRVTFSLSLFLPPLSSSFSLYHDERQRSKFFVLHKQRAFTTRIHLPQG